MSVFYAWVRGMPSLVKIIASMALLGALIAIHVVDKREAVQLVRLEAQIAAKEADMKSKEELGQLMLEQQIEREERDEELRTIESKLSITLRLLRERPSRTERREASEVRSTCTGAELPREDGEFLAREAARADRIIVERNYYYEQYEHARQMIERIYNGKEYLWWNDR